jgi:hypothetical protein
MDIHALIPGGLRLRKASRDVQIVNHSSWETAGLVAFVREVLAPVSCTGTLLRHPFTVVFVDQRNGENLRWAVHQTSYGWGASVVRITLRHPHRCVESVLHRLVVATEPRVAAPEAFRRALRDSLASAAAVDRREVPGVPLHGGASPEHGRAVGLAELVRDQQRAVACLRRHQQLNEAIGMVSVDDEDQPRIGETRTALAHLASVSALLGRDADALVDSVAARFQRTDRTIVLEPVHPRDRASA